MTTPNLVSAADLRRVTQGSYEQKVARIQEAALEACADQLSLDRASVEPIATFEDAVVVRAEDKFYRVSVQESDSGELYAVGRVQNEDVRVYGPSNITDYVEAEIAEAVSLYLSGDVAGAKLKIKNAVPYVSSTPRGTESQVLSTVEHALERGREWKRLYEQRKSHITKFVVNHLEAIENNKLTAKFSKLEDGTILESDQSAYAALVEEDLTHVTARYESILQQIREAVEAAESGLGKARESGADIVEVYERFAKDLLDDLEWVVKLNERVQGKVTSVAGRGKLRDTLAEDLYTFEVAGRFVTEVSSRLSQVAK